MAQTPPHRTAGRTSTSFSLGRPHAIEETTSTYMHAIFQPTLSGLASALDTPPSMHISRSPCTYPTTRPNATLKRKTEAYRHARRSAAPCARLHKTVDHACGCSRIFRSDSRTSYVLSHALPSSFSTSLPSSCSFQIPPLIDSNVSIVVIAAGTARIMFVPIPL